MKILYLISLILISPSLFSFVEFRPEPKFSSSEEAAIIRRAGDKVNFVISSKCFEDFILNTKLEETNGRTNLEVYQHIKNLNAVIPVKMYLRRFTSAIAYRLPPEKTINLNRNFFSKKVSICRWAATMAHEGLGHSLGGYSHSFQWNVKREYSVPYKLGGAKSQYGGNAFSSCCLD